MAPQTPAQALGVARYVRLTTFRRDGTPVPTVVWIVPDGDDLLALTEAASGKAKRLAHTPRVLIVPSDWRGRVAPGAAEVEATATVSEEPGDLARLESLVKAKYGFQHTLFAWAGRLRGRTAAAGAQVRVRLPD